MERNMQQFLAVAEAGSISSASSLLNVTQPTITVNIRNLEEKYGATLFERTARGMVLTEYGTILYDHATIMARLESEAQKEIERRLTNVLDVIAIGTGDAWWRLFVNAAIAKHHYEKPKAMVRLETGSNLQCMWMLLSGEIAVSVGHAVPDLEPGLGVDFVPLFEALDSCFVARGHPLLDQDNSIDDLAKYPCVSTVPLNKNLRGFLSKTDATNLLVKPSLPIATLSCNSLHVCVDMVKMGSGYTVFPVDMTPMLEGYGLVPIALKEDLDSKSVGVYFRSELKENRKRGDADEKLDHQGGSSCIPTQTDFERLSSISGWASDLTRPFASWDIPPRMR